MKALFALLIGLMTGNCYLFLDGEDLSSDEGDSSSTKTKSESSQTNKDISQTKKDILESEDISQTKKDIPQTSDKNDSGPSASTSGNKTHCSLDELLKDRPERIEDMFEKLYLKMHSHENELLEEERNVYRQTGQIEEHNHHARMADSRKNDYDNLTYHTQSRNTGLSEGETSFAQNKRDHVDTQDESDVNQSEVNKKRKDSED